MTKDFFLWGALNFLAFIIVSVHYFYPSFFVSNEITHENAIPVPIPEISVEVLDYLFVDRISAYNPVPRQTDGDPNVSSCGPNREKQIAVSRDLFFDDYGRKHLCGVTVTVVTDRGEVFTDYVIWDTMNPRFNNTIDVMFPHTNEYEAYDFGVTTGVLYFHED